MDKIVIDCIKEELNRLLVWRDSAKQLYFNHCKTPSRKEYLSSECKAFLDVFVLVDEATNNIHNILNNEAAKADKLRIQHNKNITCMDDYIPSDNICEQIKNNVIKLWSDNNLDYWYAGASGIASCIVKEIQCNIITYSQIKKWVIDYYIKHYENRE